MSNRKTTEERITTLNKKMEPLREKLDQLEKQKEALESAKKEADRRARTHLLIQVGGVVAHYLDRELMDGDDDLLGTFLEQQEKNGHFFTRAMYRENAKPKTSPDEYERKLIAAEKSAHKNAAKTDAKEKKTNEFEISPCLF